MIELQEDWMHFSPNSKKIHIDIDASAILIKQ